MKIKTTGYNQRFIVNVSSRYQDIAKKIIDDLNKLKANRIIDSVSDEILGMIFDVWIRRKERGYYNMSQSKISEFTDKQIIQKETEDYGLKFFSPIPLLGEYHKKGIDGTKNIKEVVDRILKWDRTVSLLDLANVYYDALLICRQIRSNRSVERLLEEEFEKKGINTKLYYYYWLTSIPLMNLLYYTTILHILSYDPRYYIILYYIIINKIL